MKRRLALLLALAGTLPTATVRAAAPSTWLSVDPTTISDSERAPIERFLEDVRDRLPPKLVEAIQRPVLVKFRKLDRADSLSLPACLGDDPTAPTPAPQTLGQTSRTLPRSPQAPAIIELHSHLKAEILAGPSGARTYPCGHRNTYRLALATLIHELGHVYDLSDPKTPEEQATLRFCERSAQANPGKAVHAPNAECLALKYRQTLSTRETFLNLLGWVETGLVLQTRAQGNQNQSRSPDPYEFKNPREAFAVNFEYFLLDPEYACRRPAVQDYLEAHFGLDPHPERRCRANTQILVGGSETTGAAPAKADIRPERVYEIHELFAGKGPQLMSRWGHSLYRIVLCAPERAEPGPACMNDIAHHVVVSFRASVSDSAISYWKGLIGKYPSVLVTQSLMSVIEEYNKGEFRELVSLPIRLSPAEKRLFLHRLTEMHWDYSGRYRFITNNCATEALNFLKGILDDRRLQSRHPVSPKGLHAALIQLGVVDASVIRDLGAAVNSGHYFASKKPEVDRAHQGLLEECATHLHAKCTLGIPASSSDYLNLTTASQRHAWYDQLLSWGSKRQTLASRFFLLESYVLRQANRAYMQRLARVIEAGDFSELPKDSQADAPSLQRALSRLRELQTELMPIRLRTEGYGIPIDDEDSTENSVNLPTDLVEEQKRLVDFIRSWAGRAFRPWLEEIEATQKDRLFYLKEMRQTSTPPPAPSTLP